MLILKHLFSLSDEELEFLVNDRRSFEEFVGLGVMNNIPDAYLQCSCNMPVLA
jgi:IS5 family transposase